MTGLTVVQRWRNVSLFQRALLVSVGLHAAVLTVRFVDPQAFDSLTQDAPLEVVLVNARSEEPPEQAQAVAQVSLAGGGQADRGMASSILAASENEQDGDPSAQLTAAAKQSLQQQQNLLLSRVKEQITALSDLQASSANTPQEKEALEVKRRQMVKLLATIEKRINAENARPRKRYVSPAVREAVYAAYYDTMRRAIEERGTAHFPEKNGKKLYGTLTMIVTVNHTGEVLEAEVVRSSGNAALDGVARDIARAAGPFGRFSQAMRKTVDQLVVVSQFTFTRDETLKTQAMVPQ